MGNLLMDVRMTLPPGDSGSLTNGSFTLNNTELAWLRLAFQLHLQACERALEDFLKAARI